MLLSSIAQHLKLPFFGEDLELDSMNELALSLPSQLTFAINKKYSQELESSKSKAFLIIDTLVENLPKESSYIICPDVSISMAQATKLFNKRPIEPQLPSATIGEGSMIDSMVRVENGTCIGSNVIVMAGAYIGANCVIGDDTTIYPNVTIYRDTIIGKECIIHAGVVIGADGFGFSHTKEGEHIKIYQNGNVIIEDCVEIGANCAIDRAVFNSTIIRRGTKLDNFIHIAHNCDIGEHSIFVAQTGVGGSTKLGRNCVVSGQSAFSDHLNIAPFSTFSARSGVTKSIEKSGGVYSGFPLMNHKEWKRLQVKIARLND
ncbi:UDP-3-O-[3-hydroxymyristoyl] glucosamine N-acyltransferase [Sulfurimonas denitrificans DSM 1251]|uniref:UDP-3-O-acylglucosamine N-acyltransferase 2 n=1 Tax=Sulfurimonas denitrificans (strain ATCC 33889 / DSM 1251) TaxID=326298 RepID=LPXD2_SULDN|nr:UDP-3-O-(3-hydroxymyristoyl)glucosamine N-acyltransferase [Sulfurimonas denitrificans]Q30RG4.1 RecName: Full=UDP-3-O-acylglucosamine N-acyltransferase 2 [Sulfurimonas denitrificans DSM 1251]ABB44417.1 UDP-3-O-[3-hydroxymyristoyl] glucosamine N-acyltransferase [Sulfurimonas denitrificans DSM 1251]MDD3442968.1 UDP-3-O-(3-hydroxymyristoyl)glucosamine N-acyltransferase [Sulfurimonas denitrificans]